MLFQTTDVSINITEYSVTDTPWGFLWQWSQLVPYYEHIYIQCFNLLKS